jgi:hypothetical protein
MYHRIGSMSRVSIPGGREAIGRHHGLIPEAAMKAVILASFLSERQWILASPVFLCREGDHQFQGGWGKLPSRWKDHPGWYTHRSRYNG